MYSSCLSAMLLSTVCINDSSNMASRTSATASAATFTALVLRVDVTNTIPNKIPKELQQANNSKQER